MIGNADFKAKEYRKCGLPQFIDWSGKVIKERRDFIELAGRKPHSTAKWKLMKDCSVSQWHKIKRKLDKCTTWT